MMQAFAGRVMVVGGRCNLHVSLHVHDWVETAATGTSQFWLAEIIC